jgi:hypothetical protein
VLVLLAGLSFALAGPAHAVDEIQVYNAEIAAPGQFTLQQHLNYVWKGSTEPDFPNGFASNRTLNGTPELAYGVTDWFELGLYAPFAIDSSGTFLPGGAKVRTLFVSPHAEERKVFYGLNVELSWQSSRFSQDPVGLEFRPILGLRDLGWEFIVNPIVDLGFGGPGSSAFAPAARLARQVEGDTWLGVEYYSNYSPIGAIPPTDQQGHTLFAVADFKLLGLDVNIGMGFGLTGASDQYVTKIILGKAF